MEDLKWWRRYRRPIELYECAYRCDMTYALYLEHKYGEDIDYFDEGMLLGDLNVVVLNPVRPVYQCDLCGVMNSRVDQRWSAQCWNHGEKCKSTSYLGAWCKSETPSKHKLCVGCWNKIKPIVRMRDEYFQTRTLINKLAKARLST